MSDMETRDKLNKLIGDVALLRHMVANVARGLAVVLATVDPQVAIPNEYYDAGLDGLTRTVNQS